MIAPPPAVLNFTGGTLQLTFSQEFDAGTVFDIFDTFDTAKLAGTFENIDVIGSFYTGLTWSESDGLWTSSQTLGGQTLSFSSATGTLAVVPEPAAVALAGIGIVAAGTALRRRARRTR